MTGLMAKKDIKNGINNRAPQKKPNATGTVKYTKQNGLGAGTVVPVIRVSNENGEKVTRRLVNDRDSNLNVR